MKKQMNRIPELKEKFISQCPNSNFGEYVWETTMGPQMGYSFSTLHSLAYSFVGIQTLILATNYPSIYWNCACLITNSGGNEDAEDEEDDDNKSNQNCISELISVSNSNDYNDDESEAEEDDEDGGEEDATKKKKKARNTNYGKISTAIGTMQHAGISVSPPDINKSSFTFIPDVENNTIIYGIKGINRIGDDLVKKIINNRPYENINDFILKIKPNKPQMVNLIKSGAFDKFGYSREHVMEKYIESITDKKRRLTLQNLNMLIEKNLIPNDYFFEIRLFNFNKYLKKLKSGDNYILDDIAFPFYERNFDMDFIWYEEDKCFINQKVWERIYKKGIEPIKDFIKENSNELLQKLNNILLKENWNKYCLGNISKWEMDSISFYYHDHELAKTDFSKYDIEDFYKLPEEPEIERIVSIKGRDIPLYKIHRIAGTVLDKNKNKNTVTILTTSGVVNIKIYQSQFAQFDKQISEKLPSGRKRVLEKSWFTRGNKLLITGIRKGDSYIPKKYKNSGYTHVIELIDKIDENGDLSIISERVEID